MTQDLFFGLATLEEMWKTWENFLEKKMLKIFERSAYGGTLKGHGREWDLL